MSYDLTLTSPVFNASGKYGSSLSGGYGQVADLLLGLTEMTIEGWFKTTATTLRVIAGSGGNPWVAVDGGKFRAAWGQSTSKSIYSTANVNDGVWHHFEFNLSTTTGGVLWIDGVQVATADNSGGVISAPVAGTFGVGRWGTNATYDFVGELDEIAVSSGFKHTAPFTPGPVSNAQSGLRAVYHLNGDGINSAGLAAPADTTKPTATAAAVANSTPTVVAITMSEAMDGAFVPAASAFTVSGHTVSSVAISGTVINLTCSAAFANGEAARTVAYTQPGTNNARDLAGNLLDNFTGLAITNNVAAPGDTVPPAFVSAQVTNSQPSIILVTMNETLAASVPPVGAFTASGGRTVTAVSIAGTVASVTVNTPYAAGDVITIAYTQPAANPRLQDAAGNLTATFAAQPVTNNVAAMTVDTSKILFSPYTWDVQPGYAKAINGGAYFRLNFSGASCTLNFDMSAQLTPYPKLSYRVDKFGPWVTVDLAATIAIAIPSELTGYASHFLEVRIRSTSEVRSRWVTQAVAVKLIGVTLAANAVLSKPPEQPIYGLYYGDSITEGINTVTNVGDAVLRSDSGQGWAYLSAVAIGAECGIVGFGRQGLISQGNPDVPVFQNTWNYLWEGVARSFARAPDYIVINQGTNDGGANIQVGATQVLNGLLAATPASTKIIVLRPFNGASNASWAGAVAGCTTPSRVTHVDTTGWFITTDSIDGVHPNGFANASRIAPLMAGKLREILGTVTVNAAPATVTGASTFTTESMVSSGTLRANQACQWTWFAGGSIGSTAGSPVHGSGTLNAQAKLVATGLPAGAGYIMARFADGGRYYQEGTAA